MSENLVWPDWISDPQRCYREHYRIEKRVLVTLPYHGMDERHLPYLSAFTRATIIMGVWADIPPQNRAWSHEELVAGKQHAPLIFSELRENPDELLTHWNRLYEYHLIPQWIARGSREIARSMLDLCRNLRYMHEEKWNPDGTLGDCKPCELFKPQFRA